MRLSNYANFFTKKFVGICMGDKVHGNISINVEVREDDKGNHCSNENKIALFRKNHLIPW